jgi:hypothetical protein
MLGIEGKWVAAAYVLCIASTLLCVIYGLITWNRGAEKPGEAEEDVRWAKEEKKVEQDM